MSADPIIGRPLSRLDGPVKVRGEARYVAEIPATGLAHATLVCSSVASGRIVAIDVDAALRAPGVALVMTYRNAPKMGEPPLLLYMVGASFTRAPVMQDPIIRWAGEPVAVVVADTLEQADHAATLVRVTYDEAPARLDFDALKAHAEQPSDVLGQPPELRKGDAEAALAEADVAVDEVYRTPRHHHGAIELHACMAEWHSDDHLTLHDASQGITYTRTTLAKVFDMDPRNIRVVSRFVGGGFGNKMVWNHQLLCVAAARLVRRPVRLVLSREAVFQVVGGRTQSEQRVALGARTDCRLSSLIHEGVTTIGVDSNGFAEQFTFPARHSYASESYHVEQRVVELNMAPNSSMRAPGESIGSFALESALDELAVKLRVDPLALRLANEPAQDPTSGLPFSARNVSEVVRRGAERFGWRDRPTQPRSRREGEWWIGYGTATSTYPYSRFPGATATVCITADGRAVIRAASQDMGMGTSTVQVQYAAERLGLSVDDVTFEYGDSNLPDGVPSAGSAQTASLVAAVAPAVSGLFAMLIELAGEGSPLAGCSADEVQPRDGGLYRPDGAGEAYAAILARAGRDHVESTATSAMPEEMVHHSIHSFGTHFCEVRVSEVTGEVRVVRWLGSYDVGRVFNPKTAASQLRGGIVMGLGMALTEEAIFDERSGRFLNPSLAEYHVPVHADVPDIDVIWTDIPDPVAPAGGRGVGEIGIVGVAAAIANAVYNATGKRIRELPITPDRVLMATPVGRQAV